MHLVFPGVGAILFVLMQIRKEEEEKIAFVIL